MATTQADVSGLMEKRARALASVLLTRRKGAMIEDTEVGSGIDLVVTLPARRKAGLRQLGVELKSALEPATAEQATAILRAKWPIPTYGPFPFPVVVFFFTMQNDGAWYSWVAEPVIADGKAQLPLRNEPDCQPLTDDSLEELLDRVDAWYDVHYSGLTAAPTGKSPKKS
jgi:hypothetical protein